MKRYETRLMLFLATLALLFSMSACKNDHFGVHVRSETVPPEITSYPEASDTVLVYPTKMGSTEVYYTDGGNAVLYMAYLCAYDNEEEKKDILNSIDTVIQEHPEYVEKVISFDGYAGILFGWQYCKQLTVEQIVQRHTPKPPTPQPVRPETVKILTDLRDYSESNDDYNASAKAYDSGVYDGKNCSYQVTKLKNRIDKETEKVYFGKTESAVIKIFSKSTPDGILKAIADAALTYDEMARVVDYIAGDRTADVDAYVKEIKEKVNGEEVTIGWSGRLASLSSDIVRWIDAGEVGKDLNEGWSIFDDLELYKRLRAYSESDGTNGLSSGDQSRLNDIGTKDIAEDNAWWQLRSIAEKLFTKVNLSGAPAARLVMYLLLYAIDVAEDMSGGTVGIAATDTNNSSPFSAYFKNKAELAENIPSDLNEAKEYWNPYAGLGDYDALAYLLAFNDFYTKGYGEQNGVRSCAKLFGYAYQYAQNLFHVALGDRIIFSKQLRYLKLDVFTDAEWLDFVSIVRDVYEGGLRYSEAQYQSLISWYFDFQGRKETFERRVYVIANVINERTYTGEMQKSVSKGNNGIRGLLALGDWFWTYSGSERNMKNFNKANTDYREGKNKNRLGTGTKEVECEGRFYFEYEELNVASYILSNMTKPELSGALYFFDYMYSASLISKMQNYSKEIVLIKDGIKEYSEFVSVPESETDKKTYAQEQLATIRTQVKDDWIASEIDSKADAVNRQYWSGMRDDLQYAKTYEYMKVKAIYLDSSKGDWETRCEFLEDRIIARVYSCCGQRVSESRIENCPYGHKVNKDGTAVTKDYDELQEFSRFVKEHEEVLTYWKEKNRLRFLAY